MECSVCKTRSSVGYCPDCQQLLCEACGVVCAECGVMLCETHRVSHQGEYLCRRCAQKADAALQHSTPAPRHRPQALQEPEAPGAVEGAKSAKKSPDETEAKGFSFQDLMDDLEEDNFKYQTREDAPAETAAEAAAPEVESEGLNAPDRDAFGVKRALVSDDPNEFRVLGDSGQAARDFSFCMKTYYIAGAAFFLLFLISYFPWFRQQPYVPHLVTLIAVSGFFWSGYGIYKYYDEEMRKYFLPTLILNLLFSFWGFILIRIS